MKNQLGGFSYKAFLSVLAGAMVYSSIVYGQNVGGGVSTSNLALDASVNGLQVSQGSTTSGQKGTLAQGAVTTSPPAYTTAQTSPLSLDTAGNLRTNCVTGCAATTAILPVASAAAESGHAFKASAGTLYSLAVTSMTGTDGFLMVFNATTVPADGAVTPLECIHVPGNSERSLTFAAASFTTGISVAISSTGCFTKTVIAAGGFFSASFI